MNINSPSLMQKQNSALCKNKIDLSVRRKRKQGQKLFIRRFHNCMVFRKLDLKQKYIAQFINTIVTSCEL